MRLRFLFTSSMLLILCGTAVFFYPPAVWVFVVIIPFIVLGCYDMLQKEHTVWRNFPVIGHTRWIMENLRPMVQ
jgi:hypothetical protein